MNHRITIILLTMFKTLLLGLLLLSLQAGYVQAGALGGQGIEGPLGPKEDDDPPPGGGSGTPPDYHKIIGNIDGVNSNAEIWGWTCAKDHASSIQFHVYVGGAAGSGTMVGSGTANRSSEAAVANACRSTGTKYRYLFKLTDSVRAAHAGKGIYVHGISPFNLPNYSVNNGGKYKVPVLPPVSGSISASNPGCTLSGTAATCSTQVNWTSSNATNPCVYVKDTGQLWTCKGSGAQSSNWAYTRPAGHTLELRADKNINAKLLGSVVVKAKPATVNLTCPSSDPDGNFALSWSQAGGINTYDVDRRLGSGSWVSQYNGGNRNTNVSLTQSGDYQFRVRACYGSNCGAFSSACSVSVKPTATGVPVFSNVELTNTNPWTDTNNVYTISWSGASGIDIRYQLGVKQNNNSWVTSDAGTKLSITAGGKPDGIYYYRTRACSGLDHYGRPGPICSNWSATKSIEVKKTPEKPSWKTCPSSAQNAASFEISINDTYKVTGYEFHRKVGSGAWSSVQNSSSKQFNDNLNAGVVYHYRARACKGNFCGPFSTNCDVKNIPGQPGDRAYGDIEQAPDTDHDGTVIVNWSAANGPVQRYEVIRTLVGNPYQLIYSGSNLSYTDTGLTDGKYRYHVRAVYEAGESSYIGLGEIIVNRAPDKPLWLTCPKASRDNMSVTWSEVAGSSSYELMSRIDGSAWSKRVLDGNTRNVIDNVVSGKHYEYQVKACKSGNCGNFSAICSSYGLPGMVTASFNDVTYINPTEYQDDNQYYELSWNTLAGATRYQVQEIKDSSSYVTVYNDSGTILKRQNMPLGRYGYRLRACVSNNDDHCDTWNNVGGVQVVAANVMPTLAIVKPVYGDRVAPNQAFTVEVNANDSDGSIVELQFRVFEQDPVTVAGKAGVSTYSASLSYPDYGIYPVIVEAKDDRGGVTAQTIYLFFSDALDKPVLLSPAQDGVVKNTGSNPCFSWEPVNGANSYRVQISRDGNFTDNRWVRSPAQSEDTSLCWDKGVGWLSRGDHPLAIPETLDNDHTYHWRVRANQFNENDVVLGTVMSDAQRFSLRLTTGNVPVIVGHMIPPLIDLRSIELKTEHFTIEDNDSSEWTIQVGVGDHFITDGNVITVVPDYYGELSVPVTASDGEHTSEVYQAKILVAQPANATPDAPLAPVFRTAPPINTESEQTGATAGEFRVDESGQATYSVEIMTAPASGGVSPQLGLSYSSMSKSMGYVGMGWSINGTSSISRCRKTPEQDGANSGIYLDNRDRFCLDGQRLVLVSGTHGAANAQYRTETDSGVRVSIKQADSLGPVEFEVLRKDGTVSVYGGDNATQRSNMPVTRPQSTNNKPISWSLASIDDSSLNGNRITYTYYNSQSNGELYLTQIDYPPNNRITLEYGDVGFDKGSVSYLEGARLTRSKRLNRVDSYAGDDLLRSYRLTYQHATGNVDRLTSIQECADLAATICLPATTFEWTGNETTQFEAAPSYGNRTFVTTGRDSHEHDFIQITDLNGDAIADLIYYHYQQDEIHYRYGNGGRTFGANNEFRVGVRYHNVPDPYNLYKSLQVVDINGDAYADILYLRKFNDPSCHNEWDAEHQRWDLRPPGCSPEHDYEWVVRYGSMDGFSDLESLNVYVDVSPYDPQDILKVAKLSKVADMDSDGLPDLLFPIGSRFYLHRNLRNGFAEAQIVPVNGLTAGSISGADADTQSQMDFNRDGQVDFIYKINDEFHVLLTKRDGNEFSFEARSVFGSSVNGEVASIIGADINGDGLSELIHRAATNAKWMYRINKGYFEADVNVLGDLNGMQLVDINHDGYQDLTWQENDCRQFRLWRPEQETFGTQSTYAYPCLQAVESNRRFQFTDVNGDGAVDFVLLDYDGNLKQWRIGIQRNRLYEQTDGTARATRVINKITDGMGMTTEIEYSPISEPTIYTPGSGTENLNYGNGSAVFDIKATPMYVVSKASSSSPVSFGTSNADAMVSVRYQYAGARMQAGGRGFLGFEFLTTIDDQTGVKTITQYRQDYPYVGRPLSTTKLQANDQPLSESVSEWDTVTTVDHLPLIYLRKSIEKGYGLSGNLISTEVMEVTDIDGYGNQKTMVSRVYAGDEQAGNLLSSTTTNSQYAGSDLKKWLARISRSSVTRERPGLTPVTRTSAFSYDDVTGMLVEEINEPDSTDESEKLTTLYKYDQYGNIIRKSQCSLSVSNCGDEPESGLVAPSVNASARFQVHRVIYTDFDAEGRFALANRNSYGQSSGTVVSRNRFGQPTLARDIFGKQTRTAYDRFGREYFASHESGSWSEAYKFFCDARCRSGEAFYVLKKAAGAADTYEFFDKAGRSVRKVKQGFDGRDIITVDQYDVRGLLRSSSVPAYTIGSNGYTRTDYDLLERITHVTYADDSTTHNSYGYSLGLSTQTITNQLNQTRIEYKNALGETQRVTDNLGGSIQYEYDINGRLSKVYDVNNQLVSHIQYNRLGQKISIDDADKGEWHYRYNALDELVEQTDPKGQRIDQYYDAVGRVFLREEFNGSAQKVSSAWTYDYTASGTGLLLREEDRLSDWQKTYQYDGFGRVTHVTTQIRAGNSYTQKTTYDHYGRVFQQFDGSGQYNGLQNVYQANGYIACVKEASPQLAQSLKLQYQQKSGMDYQQSCTSNHADFVYHHVLETDELGNTTREWLGNNTIQQKRYDVRSGFMDWIKASGGSLQNLDVEFDAAGNLKSRVYASGGKQFTEQFGYDGLNRLVSINGVTTTNYDGRGNITWKQGIGDYTYGGSCNGQQAGPHAVTQADANRYCYDANGNQTHKYNGVSTAPSRRVEYATFDKASAIHTASHSTNFQYDVNRNRYLREDRENGVLQRVTYYVGNVEVIWRDGYPEFKRSLGGFALQTIKDSFFSTHYLYKDHLGSIDVMADETGIAVEQHHFDPWGKRQTINNDLMPVISNFSNSEIDRFKTQRGFTGHEHIDEAGLVHMNGRIYDYELGRFMQADPFVQEPKNSQSLNRYSYVLNNPLSYTDPTGYFSLKKFVKKYWRAIAAIAISIYLPQAGAELWGSLAESHVAIGAITGFVSGGVATGTWKGALTGAFTGALFGDLGEWNPEGGAELFQKSLAHGMVGGIGSVLNGGKFGHGFFSAGVTQGLSRSGLFTDNPQGWQRLGNAVKAALVGGSMSRLTGGKFANGAVTGAFSRLLNDDNTTGGKKKKQNKPRQMKILDANSVRLTTAGSSKEFSTNTLKLNLFKGKNRIYIKIENIDESLGAGFIRTFNKKLPETSVKFDASVVMDGENYTIEQFELSPRLDKGGYLKQPGWEWNLADSGVLTLNLTNTSPYLTAVSVYNLRFE